MTINARKYATAALLALLPAAAVAMAGDPADEATKEEQKREVRRVVVQPGGEPQVFVWKEGDGPMPAFDMLIGRGFLGVQTTELTPDLRRHFGAPEDAGVLVGHVQPDSPADKAGLQVGDVLTQVDGEAVESTFDVGRSVRKKKDGETVSLEVLRDGTVQNLTATIVERERPAMNMRHFHCPEGEDCKFELLGDPITVGPAMQHLERVLGDKELQEGMLRFRNRNQELEKRLQELETRLKELEKQLDKGGSK